MATGLDCLREALKEAGATRQQINSPLVPLILDIFTKNPGIYKNQYDLEATKQQLEQNIQELKDQIADLVDKKYDIYAETATIRKEQEDLVAVENRIRKECVTAASEYADKFFKALEACESPEGRDRLRLAQIFINTVNIDSKYDNTELIRGLWHLLDGAPVEEMDKLEKVPSTDCFKPYKSKRMKRL